MHDDLSYLSVLKLDIGPGWPDRDHSSDLHPNRLVFPEAQSISGLNLPNELLTALRGYHSGTLSLFKTVEVSPFATVSAEKLVSAPSPMVIERIK